MANLLNQYNYSCNFARVKRGLLEIVIAKMPKGKFLKNKGFSCNNLIEEVHSNCKAASGPTYSYRTLLNRSKCKKEYRRHLLFEPVRPETAVNFLEFQKPQNHLYSDQRRSQS